MYPDRENFTRLAALSAIYLVWGAIASLNDILIPYLKSEFGLDYAQAARVQLIFYAAYFLLSLPCGRISRRFGYRTGILAGLSCAIGGCLLMLLAPLAGIYGFFLVAVFVLAAGITMLQVAANPYVMTLGPGRTAPSRLTLVQSFHSLGTTVGPLFGAVLIFSAVAGVFGAGGQSAQAVQLPYTILALVLAAIAVLFSRLQPRTPVAGIDQPGALQLIREHPRLLLGSLGIFFYVGAEISIGSFLVNYLGERSIAGLAPETAGKFVSVYWGCALLGRYVGAVLLRYVPAGQMLVAYAMIAAALVAVSLSSSGWLAAWSILLVGFFNSIMFPTIFALVIRDFRPVAHTASGVLCLGIVGGAVISQAQGVLADLAGIQLSYALPLFCYLYIVA